MIRHRNAVHCNHCDTTIDSSHRHEFRSCQCTDPAKRVSVDGGYDYRRRLFGDESHYDEIVDCYEDSAILEHTGTVLRNVHAPWLCAGRPCTIHNRTDHSKRGWLQVWNPHRGLMQRVSPTSGRLYIDPDEKGTP